MSNFITNILSLLLMVAIALIAMILVVAGFIGVGALFARYTELTLFQATIVAVPVGLGTFYLFRRVMEGPVPTQADEWDEWEEWDEDLDFEDLPPEDRRRVLQYVVELFEEEFGDDVVIQPKSQRKRRHRYTSKRR